MPLRPGNWQLLNHSVDPVGGSPGELTDLIGYYTRMAETINSEARSLQAIGDGDTSQLKGESADAIRKRSREVAKSLTQTAGRYDAVRKALSDYAPALDQGIAESRAALNDAEAADSQSGSSSAMPDPSANRAKDAPPMTEDENAAVHARNTAMTEASDSASGAVRRLNSALGALNAAGSAAADVIKQSFDDGLVDTRGYKIRENFLKFLRILIKVLMWIGIALSVIALIIPGLGALAFAAMAVAVVSLAASTALAAMGEGSWLDVILGAVAVLMLGAGALVAKAVQTGHKAALGAAAAVTKPTGAARQASGMLIPKVAQMTGIVRVERLKMLDIVAKNPALRGSALTKINSINANLKNFKVEYLAKITKIGEDFKAKPQFWNVLKKDRPDYIKADLDKLKDIKKNWTVDRLLSIDRVTKYKELQGVLQSSLGITTKAPPAWHYFNAGRVVYGWANNIFKLGTSTSGAPGDTTRWAEFEAGKTTLMTPKI
ncbi:MAG: hypothetical protein JWQ43_1469 [Glaciihabitans sp.]|nr:hypothetical protein [Glaciihabitans sp.]